MEKISDEDFFKWLLEKDSVNLNYIYDYSQNTNIAYSDEFKSFFETSPMKRLSRILQLSSIINFEPDVFHTRFEHSIGVFDRKKELIKQQLKSNSWKRFVEDNNLKVYLIAELIKSAGHDIGHLPLSHVLETTIIGKYGYHEDVGRRILVENAEIKECLEKICPGLHSALTFTTLPGHDLFGFSLLDEGNYDIDRLDYLNRDSLYTNNSFHAKLEPSTITKVALDSNGNLQRNTDGSISTASSPFTKNICVFEEDALPAIEEFLKQRISSYKNLYFSPRAQLFDSSIALFLKEIHKNRTYRFSNIYKFTSRLNPDYTQVDLDIYLEWDDIKFYNELLKFIKSTPNHNLQLLGCSFLPSISSFITMTHSLLSSSIDYSKPNKGLSDTDIEFIHMLNSIITGNSNIDKMLRSDKSHTSEFYIETNPEKINTLQTSSGSDGICFSSKKIVAYKPDEPIFIKDSNGKIFTLDTHPQTQTKWTEESSEISIAFTSTPYLHFMGFSEEEQQKITSHFSLADNLFFNASSAHSNTNAGIFGLSYDIER